VAWVGAAPARKPCCTVLARWPWQRAQRISSPVSRRSNVARRAARRCWRRGPQGEARVRIGTRRVRAQLACVAAALISGVAGIVLLPRRRRPGSLLQSGYGALSGAPLVESVRNAIEHGLHGRRHKTTRPRDANHPAGLRNSAPSGGKVRRMRFAPWLATPLRAPLHSSHSAAAVDRRVAVDSSRHHRPAARHR